MDDIYPIGTHYDKATDTLYMLYRDTKPVEVGEVKDDVAVYLDAEGQVVGIILYHARIWAAQQRTLGGERRFMTLLERFGSYPKGR